MTDKSYYSQAISQNRLIRISAILLMIVGVILLLINVYGLSQNLRKEGLGVIDHEKLRFVPDQVWSRERVFSEIDSLKHESNIKNLIIKANDVAHKSLVHVDWFRVDKYEYRQRIPVWENYFLFILGELFDAHHLDRYHYADFRRAIARGIGVCSDVSIVLTEILKLHGVRSHIVSFQKHVIVEAFDESNKGILLDPDFGVVLDVSLSDLPAKLDQVEALYKHKGFSEREINNLTETYSDKYKLFDDAYHFMTKRYIFESVSYVIKWLLPFVLIICSTLLIIRRKPLKSS